VIVGRGVSPDHQEAVATSSLPSGTRADGPRESARPACDRREPADHAAPDAPLTVQCSHQRSFSDPFGFRRGRRVRAGSLVLGPKFTSTSASHAACTRAVRRLIIFICRWVLLHSCHRSGSGTSSSRRSGSGRGSRRARSLRLTRAVYALINSPTLRDQGGELRHDQAAIIATGERPLLGTSRAEIDPWRFQASRKSHVFGRNTTSGS
jgi:hypothetical protein